MSIVKVDEVNAFALEVCATHALDYLGLLAVDNYYEARLHNPRSGLSVHVVVNDPDTYKREIVNGAEVAATVLPLPVVPS